VKKARKNGRPPSEFSPAVVDVLDAYEGASTVTALQKLLGISSTVFYKWLKDEPSFSEAVMRVRARCDDEVEAAFMKRAVGYTTSVYEDKLDKDGGVQTLNKEIHVASDTGAALNWLKNRRPDEWRDKKVVEIEGSHVDLVLKAAQDLGIEVDDNG